MLRTTLGHSIVVTVAGLLTGLACGGSTASGGSTAGVNDGGRSSSGGAASQGGQELAQAGRGGSGGSPSPGSGGTSNPDGGTGGIIVQGECPAPDDEIWFPRFGCPASLVCSYPFDCGIGPRTLELRCDAASPYWSAPAPCEQPWEFCVSEGYVPAAYCVDGQWSVEPIGPDPFYAACPAEPPGEGATCDLSLFGHSRDHCGYPCPTGAGWTVISCITAVDGDGAPRWQSDRACDADGGSVGITDSGVCPPGERLHYPNPGCEAEPRCGGPGFDGCVEVVCGCDGTTLWGCGDYDRPWSHTGACPEAGNAG